MEDLNFTVTGKAMRPASSKRECFYCHQPVGGAHEKDCVLINKRVMVKMTVIYAIEVPEHWSKENIEFHRNRGSWCADNAISELQEIFNEDSGRCMCDAAHFEYLGGDSEPYLDE